MRTTSESRNTMAQPMVMRSRFFSTMLVPVWVEYMELAIMSEMPVPLPECMRMKMIRPHAGHEPAGPSMTITSGIQACHASFTLSQCYADTQVD